MRVAFVGIHVTLADEEAASTMSEPGQRFRAARFVAVACGVSAAAFGATAAPRAEAGPPNETRPNVVLIMADDVSPGMYEPYAGGEVSTPHIDAMAREGVAFRTAWATPMCSPTRAMIMTGRYASRTGFYHNMLKRVPRGAKVDLVGDHLTFGKLLRDAGYATAIAGKWHVTGGQPYDEDGGFEEWSLWLGTQQLSQLPGGQKFDGAYEDESTPSRYWHPLVVRNGERVETGPKDYGPALHTDFVLDFIREHRDEPFFVYFAMSAPHGARAGYPTNPLRGEVGDLGSGVRGRAAEQHARFVSLNAYIDFCVGRIRGEIEKLGLSDRTLLIFTSDNGTGGIAKSRAVEAGARVPLVVSGAGVRPRGMSDELTDLTDILPTLLDVAAAKLPDGYEIDGHSLAPYLRGASDHHTREWIYSYIATSQMLRDRRWLLEAVNPLLGQPNGRFYDTGGNREGKGYRDVTNSRSPEVLAARKRFDEILARHPAIRRDDPFFASRRGKRFLATYEQPEAVAKHLHNHPDFAYELAE